MGSLGQNKTILDLKRKLRELLKPKLVNWIKGWQRPMRLLLRVAAMLWLSLSLASVSLKLSWAVPRARPLRPTRASKRLSVVLRSFNSSKMKIIRIKTYKKQIEEAEEIAALNLAKFRKAQQDLEEAEERGKMAGAQLSLAH